MVTFQSDAGTTHKMRYAETRNDEDQHTLVAMCGIRVTSDEIPEEEDASVDCGACPQ